MRTFHISRDSMMRFFSVAGMLFGASCSSSASMSATDAAADASAFTIASGSYRPTVRNEVNPCGLVLFSGSEVNVAVTSTGEFSLQLLRGAITGNRIVFFTSLTPVQHEGCQIEVRNETTGDILGTNRFSLRLMSRVTAAPGGNVDRCVAAIGAAVPPTGCNYSADVDFVKQ